MNVAKKRIYVIKHAATVLAVTIAPVSLDIGWLRTASHAMVRHII